VKKEEEGKGRDRGRKGKKRKKTWKERNDRRERGKRKGGKKGRPLCLALLTESYICH